MKKLVKFLYDYYINKSHRYALVAAYANTNGDYLSYFKYMYLSVKYHRKAENVSTIYYNKMLCKILGL